MLIQNIIVKKAVTITQQIESCLALEKAVDTLSTRQLLRSKNSLEKVRVSSLAMTVLKIINYVAHIFGITVKSIDDLLQLNALAGRLVQNYTDLVANPNASIDDAGFVYDVSLDRLKKALPKPLDRPLKITMVGVEYAGIIKQGGLAEAIEGLSRGLRDAGHDIKLIFPKYSCLPLEITKDLSKPKPHKDISGETYFVYEKTVNGVLCQFIEHPSFDLGQDKPSVYGPDFASQTERFAAFSALAADLIYEQKDADIVHLHDWHVAGVGLKLKKDHAEEWKEGKIPPVVFTFHNNQRPMQGRLSLGTYTYDPVIQGYLKHGIINRSENLFVETVKGADAVTTVSETFGKESQEVAHGEGISFAIRQAARIGKLTGILNGANLDRWDPDTDKMLRHWKDVETNQRVDLGYDSENFLTQKKQVRVQLQKWAAKYAPNTKIDFLKPLVTYIGRFDARQKGIDRLEAAIVATLENGGQFICMGTDEDEKSKHILDRLQNKYKQGVLFLRDYRDSSGKLFYQQGNETRPGIGSLIRAAADFVYIPSHFEPCGLVQFEGWQFGSMAIGAKTGGLVDSITHGKNGFLFEKDPGETVAEALQFWQKLDDGEKETIIREVMIDVRRSSWSNAAKKYEDVYAKALQKRSIKEIKAPTTLETLKYRTLAPLANTDSPEEHYMTQFYLHKHDSIYLKSLYEKLSEEVRWQVPSPYGQRVDFSKYEQLGSFPGGRFSVSAPNAKQVELLLTDEKEEKTERVFMRKNNGVWTAHLTDVKPGQKYQYRINGEIKLDPYARLHTPSKTNGKPPFSVLAASEHKWSEEDRAWTLRRKHLAGKPQPMSIYEVHPISWKRKDGKSLNYREFADELVAHCKAKKYTHVELMGILEHPCDESWGYQPTGYFAPTSRMGSVDDFKYLIDQLHQNKIGVILDFVPAHFANDSFGLKKFDGTNQYEAHGLAHFFGTRNWAFNYGAKHFDFKQKEVREFLISSAMYWIKEMHIDALRVDCVRSLLNSEAPESANLFMADLNAVIHNHGQGAISIAEDFSGDPKVTASPIRNGLDFDMKWHSGFMHYMFNYFNTPIGQRQGSYSAIFDGINSDNFHRQILTISHDQAKAFFELNQKIKDPQVRMAQTRAMTSLLMCLPGKKLHFMTTEGANSGKWADHVSRDKPGWFDVHASDPKFSKMMEQLNELYQTESAFHEFDANGEDLEWIPDENQHIHAYRRKNSKGESFICMHNLTGNECTIPMKDPKKIKEVFNSDATEFGGSGAPSQSEGGLLKIAPLSTIILKEADLLHHTLNYFNTPIEKRQEAYDEIYEGIRCDTSSGEPLLMNRKQVNALFGKNEKMKDPETQGAQARAMASFLTSFSNNKFSSLPTFTASAPTTPPGWFDAHESHPQFSKMMTRLQSLYQEGGSLYELGNLELLPDAKRHIHMYRRKNSKGESFVYLHNFTDATCTATLRGAKEIFNSDATEFGGSGTPSLTSAGLVKIAPLSTIIFKEEVTK